MSRYWLAVPGGPRTRIRAGGVLLGRAPECDVVIDDPSVSRRQAILHLGNEGATLVVLGSAEVTVNGGAVGRHHALADGDEIGVAGRRLHVVVDVEAEASRSAWMLRDPRGHLFGVTRSRFAIGSAVDAGLCIAGWPEVAMRLHLADQLHVEALVAVRVAGGELEPGEVVVAPVGATLEHAGTSLTVVAGGPTQQAETADRRGPPERVALEFLPRGGRLSLAWGAQESMVYLPDRRCDLVALLLQPPAPQRAGDLIADEVVLARLWPAQVRSRTDLNVVIHRVRADLLTAELDGAQLIQRATGGRGTRIDVDRSTVVTVL